MAKQISEVMAFPFVIYSSRRLMPEYESVRIIFIWTGVRSA